MAEGTVLIGFLSPLTDPEGIERLRRQGVIAFAMESVPRISRAQSMDALSSQANVAGYKAVLIAADRVPRLFPMLMTAAGTVAPARVLVMGAGVAGLQAIATARRLGAVVSAFDVRPAVKEQVESLGARFLDLGVHGEETEGGYAKELTPEQQAAAAGGARGARPRLRRRDHDGADPRTPRAAPDPRLGRLEHAPGELHRRPRRRGGRQLRAHAARHRDGARGRHDRRLHEPALADGLPREPALRPQRRRAAAAPRARVASSRSTSTDEITAGACVAGKPDVAERRPSPPPRPNRRPPPRRRNHHEPLARDRAHDPRPRDLPRLRGDLEGAGDAAHAADVGDELHPRHRHRRRDHRARRGRRHVPAR